MKSAAYPVKGFLPESVLGSGRFRTNAAATPTVFGGSLKGLYTVTYAATGLFTVTLHKRFKFPSSRPPTILLSRHSVDVTNTNRFEVSLVTDWTPATRSFVIQAHQGATAFQVPSNANNWIHFVLIGNASGSPR